MTRRKSRPLLPHEIFSNLQSSQEDAQHINSSSSCAHGSSQQQTSSSQSTNGSSQSTTQSLNTTRHGMISVDVAVNGSMSPLKVAENLGSTNTSRAPGKIPGISAKPRDASTSLDIKDDTFQPSITKLIRSLSQTPSTKRRPGYLANRRSASFVIHDDETRNDLTISSLASGLSSTGPAKGASNAPESAQSFKKNSSHVRLSMSLEGKAEVTTRTGNTPSPPRSQPVPMVMKEGPRSTTGLQRSYSALEAGKESVPYTRRSMSGRSRDARTWEFYCDSDARNALTEQAEREESGSATAAIGLIRSCSNHSKVMSPNPNKRNAHSQKPDSTKRLKADFQRNGKPKLARAISSVARLQTACSNEQTQKAMNVVEKKPKGSSDSAIWQDYEGDSDKENWEPGTHSSNPRRRRGTRSHQATRILEESFAVPSQASSLDTMMKREGIASRGPITKSFSSEEKENTGPEMDDEIAAFMGETGTRGVEDLDCVQNLLSLSQAVWQ